MVAHEEKRLYSDLLVSIESVRFLISSRVGSDLGYSADWPRYPFWLLCIYACWKPINAIWLSKAAPLLNSNDGRAHSTPLWPTIGKGPPVDQNWYVSRECAKIQSSCAEIMDKNSAVLRLTNGRAIPMEVDRMSISPTSSRASLCAQFE